MSRLDKHHAALLVARTTSLLGTCARRTVGCVLMSVDHRVKATGYNGVMQGAAHCIDMPCGGEADEHGNTARCAAIHAEVNAVLHCDDRHSVAYAYCTDSPCRECAKILCSLPNLREVHYVRFYTEEGLTILRSRKLKVMGHPGLFQVSLDELIAQYERPKEVS